MKELVIRRTVTVTHRVQWADGAYGPDIHAVEEAAEYERNLNVQDKVEALIESISYADDSDIDFGEVILIQDVTD